MEGGEERGRERQRVKKGKKGRRRKWKKGENGGQQRRGSWRVDQSGAEGFVGTWLRPRSKYMLCFLPSCCSQPLEFKQKIPRLRVAEETDRLKDGMCHMSITDMMFG